MKIELNRREIRRIIQAWVLAGDYQEVSIDSWRTNLRTGKNGQMVNCFPNDKEAMKDVKRWQCDIRAFKKVKDKLRERIMKGVLV